MQKAINSVMHALDLAAAIAPEWIQLLPDAEFSGADGRGPYAKPDNAGLVTLFNSEGRRLPVDENHSIDLAGKLGHPSPARGWIEQLEARDDGLWGRVDWTPEGKSLVEGKSYGFQSPVFLHTATKPYQVSKMLRVALTNDPNLPFLKSLHSKEDTNMLELLRKALGLPETADEAAVMAAVTAAHAAQTANAALMARVAEVAGVAADAAPDALVTALQAKTKPVAASATDVENAALKDQLQSMQSQLTTLATTTAKDKADLAITSAIEAGKIVPALKDHMIARHMRNPAEVENEIKLMPSLNAGGLGNRQLPDNGGTLTAEDGKVAALMGFDPKVFAEQSKALHGKGN